MVSASQPSSLSPARYPHARYSLAVNPQCVWHCMPKDRTSRLQPPSLISSTRALAACPRPATASSCRSCPRLITQCRPHPPAGPPIATRPLALSQPPATYLAPAGSSGSQDHRTQQHLHFAYGTALLPCPAQPPAPRLPAPRPTITLPASACPATAKRLPLSCS